MKGPRDAAPPSNIRAPLAGFGASVKRKEGAGGDEPPAPRGGQPFLISKRTVITFQLSSATPPRVAGLKRHLASARRFVS